MMSTYFCFLVSVLIGKNYAEMTCQTVQQKDTATLSCGHSEGDVTWSRDQDGGRVDILTVRKGQDSEDKHIHDPGKRFSSVADKSLTILRVISSDSGVYYCNGEPVVNLTVTPEKVPEEVQKRTCVPKSPPTTNVTMTTHTTKNPTTRVKNTDVTMTPHTTKNPTTRVKNKVTTRTVSVGEESETTKKDEKNKKDDKKKKKDGKKKDKEEKKEVKNEKKDEKTKNVTMTPHTTKNPTTRVKNKVTTRTVSVGEESETTKKDEKNKKDDKKKKKDGKKKDKEEKKEVKNEKKDEKTKNVTMTPHTTKNPTTRVKNKVTTRTVSVGEESETTKKDEKNKKDDKKKKKDGKKKDKEEKKEVKNEKKDEKTKSHWRLLVGVAAGGLVLVLFLLLVGFLIRRRWAEGDRDRRLDHVYAEISDVTQQPKDESCSSSPKEHSVYNLAGAQEVITMDPIYHTIQDPNITTNLSNGENPYFLAQNPDVPETSFD
ncbi:peptidyl-prolyl cis-trans isomerase G-like isoform X2 [Hypomesus transpacificus]|uniref:peptidyl-prolyl cis-trans isomerase G-like isoform X2 n=1 Tax=Hypomesus transpacificus TaxID=137520 RepID=UPI001F07C9B2|nr:peptidyl-prolyl cis-trans isomerase G-like isoform X2 [Hypomesus transpacificus]